MKHAQTPPHKRRETQNKDTNSTRIYTTTETWELSSGDKDDQGIGRAEEADQSRGFLEYILPPKVRTGSRLGLPFLETFCYKCARNKEQITCILARLKRQAHSAMAE